MKNKLLSLFTLAATLACGSAHAVAEGDIWQIWPCDENGVTLTSPISSIDNPIAAGEPFYFKLRMVVREMDATPWHIYRTDTSSTDDLTNPLRIRILTSGWNAAKPTYSYADYIGELTTDDNNYTDIIFKYVPKPGDFALPVRLCTANGPVGDKFVDGQAYYFDPLTSWRWECRSTNKAGSTTFKVDWFFISPSIDTLLTRGVDQRTTGLDYDLTQAGFYLKTINFDTNWEAADTLWRSVHEGSTSTVGPTPALAAKAGVEELTTLYVWSTNEAAVKVVSPSVTPVSITLPNGEGKGETKTLNVAAITFERGQLTSEFEIEGEGNGLSSHLILSAYTNFNYSAAKGTLVTDFIAVPVSCIEPQPPSIVVKPYNTTVTASSNYTHYVTELSVKFTTAFTEDVTLTVTPKFENAPDGTNWKDYLRVASDKDITSIASATNFTFTIKGGSVAPADKIYLFALRSDAYTQDATHHIQFEATTDNAAALKPVEDGGISGWGTRQGDMNILADPPVVSADATMTLKATVGVEKKLSIFVNDTTYADMATNEAYEVYVVTNANDALTYVKLDGFYKPDKKTRKLIKAGTTDVLPGITYSAKDIGDVSTIVRVKSVISGEMTDITLAMTVEEPLGFYVEAIDETGAKIATTAYQEGDEKGSGSLRIYFANGQKHYGNDIYAYLVPQSTDARRAIECPFIAEEGGQGLEISGQGGGGEDSPTVGSFVMVDGRHNASASAFKYKVELRTAPVYEDGEAVLEYGCKNTLVLNSLNIVPTVDSVNLGANNTEDEGWSALSVPMKVKQSFTANVTEPSTIDLNATGKVEVFECQWRFVNGSTAKYADNADASGIVTGNPETVTGDFTFTKTGTWTVTLKVRDKDQKAANVNFTKITPYTFKVEVVDCPYIHVAGSYGTGSEEDEDRSLTGFAETESLDATTGANNANLHVWFDYNTCDFPLTLQLVIADPGSASDNNGKLELQTSSTVEKTADKTYKVTVEAGQRELWIPIKTLDGTKLAANPGFTITPKIIAPSDKIVPESGGKHPTDADYFKPSTANRAVKVRNEAPYVEDGWLYPLPGTTNACAIGTADAITWDFTDVAPDFTKGIKITFKGGGDHTETITDPTKTAGSWSPTFTKSGVQTVTMTIEDADGGKVYFLWYYDVAVAKTLTMRPNGPTSGYGTTMSKHYTAAAGLGEGRVWASGMSAVEGHVVSANCGVAGTWNVYAYGYKVNDIDDGVKEHYHYPDQTTGYYWERTAKTGYAYPDKVYDSFLYTWVQIYREGGDDGSGTLVDKLLNDATSPEYTQKLNEGQAVSLPDEANDAGTYDDMMLEAIFSRELLKSDNMGDINADYIPDVFYDKYDFTETTTTQGNAPGQTTTTETTLSDLESLTKYNEDADYLPMALDSTTTTFDPAASNAYPFIAKWEIRGFGDCFNDATASTLADGNPNPCAVVGVKPDVNYADPATDADSTLSAVEYLAWCEFAASKGYDPTDKTHWGEWSPERPTSPILDDTDGDGFSDGYEYCFWYRAHVGYLDEKGVHRHMTGRRFDPRNPGEGTRITSAEIEKIMDPCVAGSFTALTQDSDNDGVPDIIEFYLGTNPFDFDTDGDGLPDGWELTMSGTDPLNAYTTTGTLDAARNADGDAMAITSPALEAGVMPAPFAITPYTTFAVIDPDGDSDGVQWYATKDATVVADTALVDATEDLFVVTVDGKAYGTVTQPGVTASGALATDVAAYLLDGESGAYTALMPTTLAAGSLATVSAAAETVTYKTLTADIAATKLFAAWVYGRDANHDARLADLTTAGNFGCLALGRPKGLTASETAPVRVCALPKSSADKDGRDVALLHYLVYQEFGFDPRTAWSASSPLASRWAATTKDGQSVSDVYIVKQGGFVSYATRTKTYTAYDEFLVMSFFLNNGTLANVADVEPTAKNPWTTIWSKYTTNPRGPGETTIYTVDSETSAVTEITAEENGADTDGDGVPDGWELYIMAGPKTLNTKTKELEFTFAPPYEGFTTSFGGTPGGSYWSPFVAMASSTETTSQIYLGGQANMDDLNELREFSGTDCCAAYTNCCSTILARTAQVAGAGDNRHTVDDSKWLNKFFPTDPWSIDTDGDKVSDSDEKAAFIYGSPVDNNTYWCITGGGLNPCSVDTDLDGLPDGWEKQFAGTSGSLYAGDDAHYASGLASGTGNPLEGLTDGMDGTVFDAYTTPHVMTTGADTNILTTYGASLPDGRTISGCVNRDYDHDGLENWQEYLTGTMRCWRYDDPISPWISIPQSAYYVKGDDGTLKFDVAHAAKTLLGDETKTDEFWYKTLVDKASGIYNPHLVTDTNPGVYFSRVTNGWDIAYLDSSLAGGFDEARAGGAYYWFYDRIGADALYDLWSELNGNADKGKYPNKYASCSPKMADSDQDGMDDYYELFHGMNPLLGASGVEQDTKNACDLIADAYKLSLQAFGAKANYWVGDDGKAKLPVQPQGNEYDFIPYPWLNGIASADPDGDDIPNQSESLMPKIQNAGYHTDPTPLWMTDSSYTNSLVSRFFRVPARFAVAQTGAESFTYEEKTYYFRDFDCFGYDTSGMAPAPALLPFVPDAWSVAADGKSNWLYSFEENEGFDTDHDILGDNAETAGKFGNASDPLDNDSPLRRQAMWFPGANAVLQTMPRAVENHPVADKTYPQDPSFTTFTVECWVKADETMLEGEHVIVERAIWVDPSKAQDEEYIRKNFQLAIRDGRWLTKYDAQGTYVISTVEAQDGTPATTAWTHLAATYDGSVLTLFVNGVAVKAQTATLPPEHGVYVLSSDQTGTYLKNVTQHYADNFTYDAILIGASLKYQREFDPSYKPSDPSNAVGLALDLTAAKGWNYYTRFFKGYVDEVRIWDGARSVDQVAATMKTRYSATLANDNRQDFYAQWSQGKYRYDAGVTGVVPELRYHFHFDSTPAAQNAAMVAKVPFLYNGTLIRQSRPVGYAITWWQKVLAGYAGTIYSDPAWVQWIPNTVTHLPRFDGTTLDSQYWSDDYMGDAANSGTIAKSAEPISRWRQVVRNGTSLGSEYATTSTRHWLVNGIATESTFATLFEFTARHLNQMGDDLVPLGGAFVQYIDKATGMWDENGPSTPWEVTGTVDNQGLPEWWKLYADENYPRVNPTEALSWTTKLIYDGKIIKAGEAYLLDLAKGFYADSDGLPVVGSENQYGQTADIDEDSIPDWWENFYGIQGYAATDADLDPDNDGLSNYQEYLLSQGGAPYGKAYGFPELNPTAPRSASGQKVTDYFLSGPTEGSAHYSANEYLGEIVTDHDFMEDWWENQFGLGYTSSVKYDPYGDTDGDGWSNFAECRYALWRANYAANLIDKYLDASDDSASHIPCYPEPMIGVRATYMGVRDVSSAQLVMRTSNGKSDRVDATFIIPSSADSQAKYIGPYTENAVIHTFLSPGMVLPNSIVLESALMSSTSYYRWNWDWYYENGYIYMPDITSGDFETYKYYKTRYPHIELDGSELEWESVGVSLGDTMGTTAIVNWIETAQKIGTLDCATGEMTLDMAAIYTQCENPENLENTIFRVTYSSRIGQEWPQTVYVSDTSEYDTVGGTSLSGSGRVKEGKNTVEVFLDLNNNGTYDVGEPYGMVRNVQVGWHKVPVVTIELTDDSPVIPRTILATTKSSGSSDNVGDSKTVEASLTTTIRVVRESINGQDKERQVLKKTFVNDDRNYLTEADVLKDGIFDLDWRKLNDDARDLGLNDDALTYATYRIEKVEEGLNGATSNTVISTFTKTFETMRPVASGVAPYNEEPVYAAAPTFRFSASAEATAFALQICDAGGNEVWSSGTQPLPGRDYQTTDAYVCSYTPPVFVGETLKADGTPVLVDGGVYSWRVVLMNAKFNSFVTSDYTPACTFQMDVANKNRYPELATGYGAVDVAVRYYGPASQQAGFNFTNVIVEAFANADFTGQPLARTRLADAAALRKTDDITTVNAHLTGVQPGTVYVRAFIDSTSGEEVFGNGTWDRFESWGYANQIGTGRKAIYNPSGVTVSGTVAARKNPVQVVVYIEDTDVDQNEVPDCLQEFRTSSWANWWNWAYQSDDDAEALTDEDDCVTGDVMAYAEETRTVVTFSDGTQALVAEGVKTPWVGDTAVSCNNGVYDALYAYGDKSGVGRSMTVTDPSLTITAVKEQTVVLLHAQVYAKYGYDVTTANATAYAEGTATHTKLFTAADKKHLMNYLEAMGLVDAADLPPAEFGGSLEAYADWLGNTGSAADADKASDLWDKYSLRPGDPDQNRDGLADGWQLYVMCCGDQVASCTPWTSPAAARTVTPGGEGLTWVQECDGGHLPTDPWCIDTDQDGVTDYYAYQYHLKGEDRAQDNDGDGLSNEAEYLISEVFKFAKCDPDLEKTDAHCVDYFLKVGDLYLGEIFTDHDQMMDTIEDEFGTDTMNRLVYDAHVDGDANGWSNFGQMQYRLSLPSDTLVTYGPWISTNLTIAAYNQLVVRQQAGTCEIDMTKTRVDTYEYENYGAGGWEYPVVYRNVFHRDTRMPTPDIRVTVSYTGNQLNTQAGALVVKFYNDATMKDLTAVYLATNAVSKGVNAVTLSAANCLKGHVHEGRNWVAAYALLDKAQADSKGGGDDNGDTTAYAYQAGAPCGILTDVEIGWHQPSFEVELTDMSAIFDRIDLFDGASARAEFYGANSVETSASNDVNVATLAEYGDVEHVRIVPYKIRGVLQDAADNEDERQDLLLVRFVTNRVVREFDVDVNAHPFIHEGDFLTDTAFDVDWDGCVNEIINDSKVDEACGDVTCIKYRIIIGKDGPVGPESNLDTTTVVRAFQSLVERRFETVKSRSNPVNLRLAPTDGLLYAGRPTFQWQYNESTDVIGRAGSAAYFGCSYTAFILQVMDKTTGKMVYNSGYTRLPARDADGYFTWTAPFYPTNGVYTWRVSMYNAKFKYDAREDKDERYAVYNHWSDNGLFTVDRKTGLALNDHGYGSILAAVRYAGPSTVLANGTLHVQAFDTADFSGTPLAETIITDKTPVADTVDISNTVALAGLAMDGTYYVRAYLDMNTNGVRDAWESWGFAKTNGAPIAVNLASTLMRAPVVGLYIEDTDIDGDYLPDAWEYAQVGDKSKSWDEVKDVRYAQASNTITLDTTKLGTAGLPEGLRATSLTAFTSGSFAQALLNISGATPITLEAIRAQVAKELKPTTVTITAITLDTANNQVVLSLDSDVALSIAGEYVSQIYGIDPGSSVTVTVKVYWKKTLIENWREIPAETKSGVVLGADAAMVAVPLTDKIDLSSGFYKVVVEKQQ